MPNASCFTVNTSILAPQYVIILIMYKFLQWKMRVSKPSKTCEENTCMSDRKYALIWNMWPPIAITCCKYAVFMNGTFKNTRFFYKWGCIFQFRCRVMMLRCVKYQFLQWLSMIFRIGVSLNKRHTFDETWFCFSCRDVPWRSLSRRRCCARPPSPDPDASWLAPNRAVGRKVTGPKVVKRTK